MVGYPLTPYLKQGKEKVRMEGKKGRNGMEEWKRKSNENGRKGRMGKKRKDLRNGKEWKRIKSKGQQKD